MTAITERLRRGIDVPDDHSGQANHPEVRGQRNLADVYQLDLDEEILSHLAIPESWDVLQAESFRGDLIEDAEVRSIYEWQLQHLRANGALATPTVLANHWDCDLRNPETAIGDLLDRLRERYMKNQGREALRHIVDDVFKTDPLAIPATLIKVGRDLSQLLVPRGEMYGTGDFDRTWNQYEKKVAQGPGPSFGHPALDAFFNGLNGVTFLLAPPKSYKSWQCVQCLIQNVLNGKNVWLIPLELPAHETNQRCYHMLANIPWWRYTHNRLTEQDHEELHEAAVFADGSGVYNIWKPPHGERDIHGMVTRARDAGADLVIIDQLQYIENDNGVSLGETNKTGDYFGVLDKARTLSDEGPLLIAHQFHRNPGGYESMPSVDHAKGSSSIEEVATLCLGMYQNKDMKRSRKMELGTLIARNADWAAWEVDVDLTSGCSFTITNRIDDEGS